MVDGVDYHGMIHAIMSLLLSAVSGNVFTCCCCYPTDVQLGHVLIYVYIV